LVSLAKKWNLFWGNHNIFGENFGKNPKSQTFAKYPCVVPKIPLGWYFLVVMYGNTTGFELHIVVLPARKHGVNSTRGGRWSCKFHQNLPSKTPWWSRQNSTRVCSTTHDWQDSQQNHLNMPWIGDAKLAKQ
jgi:hypothetical protein